jgi:hypothetical protein
VSQYLQIHIKNRITDSNHKIDNGQRTTDKMPTSPLFITFIINGLFTDTVQKYTLKQIRLFFTYKRNTPIIILPINKNQLPRVEFEPKTS